METFVENTSIEADCSEMTLGEISEKFGIDRTLLLHMCNVYASIRDDTMVAALSAREKETLRLLAHGLPSKQIADRLCISLHTVNSHRKHILHKTGLGSAQELTLYALSLGLL